MPVALARSCPVMGCGSTVPCGTHGRKAQQRAYDDRRGSAASRGYDGRWQAYREWFLAELHRLMVPRAGLCGSRLPAAPETADSRCAQRDGYVLGTVIDHIVPVIGRDDPRFYDQANHQLLCEACHNAKRQHERRS